MQKLQLLLVGLMTVAMTATAVPLPLAPAEESVLVWLNETGAWGITPITAAEADAYQTCGGYAPQVTSCSLTDFTNYPRGGGWSVGWVYPPPNGITGTTNEAVITTRVHMAGTNPVAPLTFQCSWLVVPRQAPQIACALTEFNGFPGGQLTADFTTGLELDGFPNVGETGVSTFDVLPGVGSWRAMLLAY